MSNNTATENASTGQEPFLGTLKEPTPRRKKSSYTTKEKYAVACGHIAEKSHVDIAKEIGREPIDVYHALRSEWARSLCYAITIERGGNERDANLKFGNHKLDKKNKDD